MSTVTTNFDPAIHGFSFPNSFDFPDFFQIKLPFIQSGGKSLADLVYGLCGGMCYAALDYYYAQMSAPKYIKTDDIPWPFFLYLWQRQLHSMGKTVLPKLFSWMVLEDIPLAKKVKQYEIPKIQRRIQEGKPVPLVLVRVKGFSDPTHNHQVLAIGYEEDLATRDFTILLYDPNHSGKQPTLTMNLSDPGQGIHLVQSTREPTRGFFTTDYAKQAPPKVHL